MTKKSSKNRKKRKQKPAATPRPPRPQAKSARFKPWMGYTVLCVGLAVLSIMVFHEVLPSGNVLVTQDDNIGDLVARKRFLPEGFLGFRRPFPLFGVANRMPFTWSNVMLWVLSAEGYANWMHAIDLSLASVFLVAFLRVLKIRWPACVLALLAAYWTGTNLTLTAAGHITKYGVLMFAAAALYCVEKTAREKRSWPSLMWAVLCGGAVGGMFLEQQDVALFFGLFIGVYALYATIREEGLKIGRWLLKLSPMVIVAFLIAGGTALRAYASNVQGIAQMSAEDDSESVFDYCTQWSVPPEETLELVAPGFFGWGTWSSEGPYWGKTGRDAQWNPSEEGRRHLRNLRNETTYVGVIPVFLALFGLLLVLVLGKAARRERSDVIFWWVALLLAIMLSFGRYFHLYRFFHMLPVIRNIRNPNKFVHVWQVVMAILSAYGVDLALRRYANESDSRRARRGSAIMAFFVGIFALAMFVASASVAARHDALVARFREVYWGEMSPVIVGNMVKGLAHGGVMAMLLSIIIGVLCVRGTDFKRWARMTAAVVACLVVGIDLLIITPHFIKGMRKKDLVGTNGMVSFLQNNLGEQSLAIEYQQYPVYGQWLTYLYPYHNISTFNFTQMPRMAREYEVFLGTMSTNRYRMWELSAVGYVMMPVQSPAYNDIATQQSLQTAFGEPAYGFSLVKRGEGVSVREVPFSSISRPEHVILRYKPGLPRHSLVGAWEIVEDKTACDRLLSHDFNPHTTVVVSPSTAGDLPVSSLHGQEGDTGFVETLDIGCREIRLRAAANRPAILLAVQKYSPEWRVTVDGKAAALRRCNYLAQGVFLPPGDHTVVFKYCPDNRLLWLQLAGILCCVLATCCVVVAAVRRKGVES